MPPDDKDRLRKASGELERGPVYLRFFSHKTTVDDEELHRVTESDGRKPSRAGDHDGNPRTGDHRGAG